MTHIKHLIRWVVLADGAQARIVAPDAVPGRFATILGVVAPSYSHAHAGHDSAHNLADADKAEFARDIAHRLDQARRDGRFDQLVLVAPGHVLHELREALGADTRHSLVGTEPKDLIKLPVRDRDSHLARWWLSLVACSSLTGRRKLCVRPETADKTRGNAMQTHVQHAGTADFDRGLRQYFAYRDLGFDAATGGRFGANVIRAVPGEHPHGAWHLHELDFQFVYILKGWVEFEYEDIGHVRLEAGSTVHQPPRIRHREIRHSDDVEILEITAPAEFVTREVPAPEGTPQEVAIG